MSSIVTINDTDLQVIEYQGQRAATLGQIDAVHKRPEGTARRTLNTNRQHLIKGDDYCKISADEFRTRFPGIISDRATEDMTLVFESGYLMLVKSFTDDLAWLVQRQLVTCYFRAKEAAVLSPPERAKPARASERYREAAVITREQLKICKLLGVDDGMAKVITAKEVRNVTGLDFTPLLTNVTATDNPRLTVTQLVERIGDGAKSEQVNAALEQLGLQTKKHWTSRGKPRSKWELTEAGKQYGALATYQAEKNEHSGYRVVWHAEVLELVQPLVMVAVADRAAEAKPKRAKAAAAPAPATAPEPQGALL